MTLQPLLTVGLTNAALATALAALLWLVHRYARAPRVIRLLALVVLLRLLVPPVFSWDLLPTWNPVPFPALTAAEIDSVSGSAPWRAPTTAPASTTVHQAAAVRMATLIWIVGIGVFAVLCVVRQRRFRILLGRSKTAPVELRERVARLAERVGLASAPAILVVDERQPPLVTRRGGVDLLVLPRALLGRLDAAELDTVLVHELAHLLRRDGLVRWIEVVACGLFWWNPAVWWTRRRLRDAEEACCDEAVLRFLPKMAAAYAGAIVKTVSLTRPRDLPDNACAMSSVHRLEERLKMILDNNPRSRRPWLSVIVVVAGLVVLGVYPTFSQQAEEARSSEEQTIEELELDFRERLLELEQRRLELELESHRAELEQRLRVAPSGVQFGDFDHDGHFDLFANAQSQEERQRVFEDLRRIQTERQEIAEVQELEVARLKVLVQQELAVRGLELEAERFELRGRLEEASRRTLQAAELEDRLLADEIAFAQRAAELEQRQMDRRLSEMESEKLALQEEGREEEAQRLDRELRRQRQRRELFSAEQELHRAEREHRNRLRARDRELGARSRAGREELQRARRGLRSARRQRVDSLEQQAHTQLEQLGALLENLGDDGGGREELLRLETTLRRLLEDRARQEEPEPE